MCVNFVVYCINTKFVKLKNFDFNIELQTDIISSSSSSSTDLIDNNNDTKNDNQHDVIIIEDNVNNNTTESSLSSSSSSLNNGKNILYISNSFEGPLFQHLISQRKPIISDIVVKYCIENRMVSIYTHVKRKFNFFFHSLESSIA